MTAADVVILGGGPGGYAAAISASAGYPVPVGVAIGVVVFGAMIYAMFAFRKSRGAVAALDIKTGTILWKTPMIATPWPMPAR